MQLPDAHAIAADTGGQRLAEEQPDHREGERHAQAPWAADGVQHDGPAQRLRRQQHKQTRCRRRQSRRRDREHLLREPPQVQVPDQEPDQKRRYRELGQIARDQDGPPPWVEENGRDSFEPLSRANANFFSDFPRERHLDVPIDAALAYKAADDRDSERRDDVDEGTGALMADLIAAMAQRRERILSALPKLGGAFLFWLVTVLVQESDRAGLAEAPVLLVLLLFGIVIMRSADLAPAREQPEIGRALLIAISLLLAFQLVYAGARLVHPRIGDIGHWVFAGGQAMLQGQNPYLLALDPSGLAALGPRFQGYKYLPLMGWAYLPLGLPFGDRGLVATNLLLQLATVVLVWRLARRLGTETAVAGSRRASTWLRPWSSSRCSRKAAPIWCRWCRSCWRCSLWERRPGMAGAPGRPLDRGEAHSWRALRAWCLLPATWPARRRYVLGLALGLLPILPYAIGAPSAFFDNIVAFNLISRRATTPSWLMTMPAGVVWASHGILLVLLLAAAVVVWRRPLTLFLRCGLCALLILASLLLGPSPHQNYHLWWLPLYSALVAVTLTRLPKADRRRV